MRIRHTYDNINTNNVMPKQLIKEEKVNLKYLQKFIDSLPPDEQLAMYNMFAQVQQAINQDLKESINNST